MFSLQCLCVSVTGPQTTPTRLSLAVLAAASSCRLDFFRLNGQFVQTFPFWCFTCLLKLPVSHYDDSQVPQNNSKSPITEIAAIIYSLLQ